jgi:hypothetical protein
MRRPPVRANDSSFIENAPVDVVDTEIEHATGCVRQIRASGDDVAEAVDDHPEATAFLDGSLELRCAMPRGLNSVCTYILSVTSEGCIESEGTCADNLAVAISLLGKLSLQ